MIKSNMNDKKQQKSGFVAIIGAPNAGKSTLVNALAKEKISIVTHKVQTTRFQVKAIYTEENSQVILVDTPGIFTAKNRFNRAMVESAREGAKQSDYIIHLIDVRSEFKFIQKNNAHKFHPQTELVIKQISSFVKKNCFLVLNKIDLIAKPDLLNITEKFRQTGLYDQYFMISAKKNQGIQDLRHYLADMMPEGVWLYPKDQLSDLPMELLTSELTREKLFLFFNQEIPYDIMVKTISYSEQNHKLRIEQVIYVSHKSQKPMIIGHKGRSIRRIGEQARYEMQALFGKKTDLFLTVRIKENWNQKAENFNALGLNYKSELG